MSAANKASMKLAAVARVSLAVPNQVCLSGRLQRRNDQSLACHAAWQASAEHGRAPCQNPRSRCPPRFLTRTVPLALRNSSVVGEKTAVRQAVGTAAVDPGFAADGLKEADHEIAPGLPSSWCPQGKQVTRLQKGKGVAAGSFPANAPQFSLAMTLLKHGRRPPCEELLSFFNRLPGRIRHPVRLSTRLRRWSSPSHRRGARRPRRPRRKERAACGAWPRHAPGSAA